MSRGEREALATLYARHGSWLLLRLSRRCSDTGLVDEVVQDTLLAVWRSASRYNGTGEVGAWIWGIAMALVSFPWVSSGVPRSLRGRPSQVKGAFGVATRCRSAAPWTCEPPRPLRAALRAGQEPALHNARHPEDTTDLDRQEHPSFTRRSPHP